MFQQESKKTYTRIEVRDASLMAMAGLMTLSSVIALVLMMSFVEAQRGGLQKDFYSSTCPKAEKIVRSAVEKYFADDSTIAPALLRLHFHDCFVQGCDGSVLISGSSAERSALANVGLRGFEVVDDAKSQLEATCPGIVSCADILALAARDAVDLSDGPRWTVALGRRDGRISSASDAADMPSPLDSITVQRQKFADKGLTDQDLVTLVGGHTIGQTDCAFFRYRLYNFTATGNADPSMSQASLSKFQELCPKDGDPSARVALDQGSAGKFDASFFRNVKERNGVLESDQRLWEDEATKDTVAKYAGRLSGLLGLRFDYEFGKAMIKLAAVGVNNGGARNFIAPGLISIAPG